MSCYPPTPAFGNFSFAPQQAVARSDPTDVAPAPASSNTIAADARRVTGILPSTHRPPLPSEPATVTASLTKRAPSAAMNTHDESSDGLEEGELSEAPSLASLSSSNGVNMSGDEGLRVDHSPMAPLDKWYPSHHSRRPSSQLSPHRDSRQAPLMSPPTNTKQLRDDRKSRSRPPKSSRAQPPPQQNKDGGGRIPSKNDRYSAAHDPPRESRTAGDKGRGLNQQGSRPSVTQYNHMKGQDSVASIPPQLSSLRQGAQAAILDMSLCGVKYDDLIREGFDPVVLGKLFVAAGLPVMSDSIPPPPTISSNGQGSSAPPKDAATKPNRPLPTEKSVLDKDAQVLREKLEKARQDNEKRERREKEQKEAETRATELARQRRTATEEEERRKREVEVRAKQDIAKKKIATMMSAAKPASPGVPMTTKAASPSVPPTPISSTPVNAAVSTVQPQPIQPTGSTPPAMMIPGLLLAPTNEAASKAATSEAADVVMSDASPAAAVAPTAAVGSSGVSQPQPPAAARRKRPMASDLYSEPSPVRRKFGAQRTSAVIIEVSDDEDDVDAAYLTPQEPKEDRQSNGESPLGTPGIASNGLNPGARRTVSLPIAVATFQVDELRKREADIQRMKAKIMAAEQKSMAAQRRKELSRAVSNSGHPTPLGTPTVGSGPFVPPQLPSQLGASKHDSVKPTAPLAALKKDSPTDNQPLDDSKKTEMDLEAQQTRARTIEERMRKHKEEIAAAENMRQDETDATAAEAAAAKAAEAAAAAEAKKQAEDREKKQRELVELENKQQKKRLEREMLEEQLRRQIAEMRQEEEDMEQRYDTLAKDLEDVNAPKPSVTPSNEAQNGSEHLRTEIEVKEVNEGPSGTEELVERQLLVEDVSNSSDGATPASATASSPNDHSPTNGGPEETTPMVISPSPVQVSSPAVTQTADSMDVDEPREPTTQDKPAPEEGVEMETSCAEGTSTEVTSGSDNSSDDSSSSEEDEDEVMVDKPEDTNSHAAVRAAVSATDAKVLQTAPPVASPSSKATSAPPAELARVGEAAVATVPEVAHKVKAIPNVFVPYQSPLEIFKSFRHHPKFAELKPDGLRSLQYSNNIDPDRSMCKYEVCGGVCNDRECEWQHFREITMKDEQILVELAANEGTTEEDKERFSAGLRDTILHFKQQGIKDFTTVAQGIAAFRRKYFGDETRVIKLNSTAPTPSPRPAF